MCNVVHVLSFESHDYSKEKVLLVSPFNREKGLIYHNLGLKNLAKCDIINLAFQNETLHELAFRASKH